jgi:putative transcriptional regulator
MTIRHHPGQDMLLAYAAGRLAEALHRVVGLHLETCTACRAEIAVLEEVGGVMLSELPPTAMSPDALNRVLARLDGPVPAAPAGKARGERWLGPGVRYLPLNRDTSNGTYLYRLRVRAGTRLPSHGHHGLELTHVITGEIVDATNRYGPGDFLALDVRHEHEPRAGGSEECICIIGSEGPPRLTGLAALLLRARF